MTTALRNGAKGPDVRTLQEALAKHGHTLKPDGHFGPSTDLSLRNYQRQQGLVADGIAGHRTLSSLGIKVTAHAPKKTPKENLQDILNRVQLSPAQAIAAQSARPLMAGSIPIQRSRTSRDGLRFIHTHESIKNVSNHLHWPGGASGVTLGPGYDMKSRHPNTVKSDLMSIGLTQSQAELSAEGAGLTGEDAKYFSSQHHDHVKISIDQECQLLNLIVGKYESTVKQNIHVDLMQYEFDAFVSFTYNAGNIVSHVAAAINGGKIIDAMLIIKRHITSRHKILNGLINRREDEINLYLFGVYGQLRY